MIRISWCSVNARMGAKPVSLRIKSASVNGVLVRQLLSLILALLQNAEWDSVMISEIAVTGSGSSGIETKDV